MADRYDFDALVTSSEALQLAEHRGVKDMDICMNIIKAFDKKYNPVRDEDLQWYCQAVFATVWNAGRVQGIREERRKKANT